MLLRSIDSRPRTFLHLADTPDSYSSEAGNLARVNAGETDIEFVSPASLTGINADTLDGIDSSGFALASHTHTASHVLSLHREIERPFNAEDLGLFYVDEACTITKMVCVLVGSSTPSVTWTVRHSTDRSATGNEVVTSGTTTTSTTTGSVVTSFNDATIPADSFIWFETTAKSGTVDSLQLSIFYRQDP